jgi:hypothetical protein
MSVEAFPSGRNHWEGQKKFESEKYSDFSSL